ncbi:MAG: D-alanyl-D-alanine carboxypeptidase [Alphaproteobacteria bacterium]|nr:D-alanyl-D-alanine carboxypeptidase [Alphaproteobacteria bacterium]
MAGRSLVGVLAAMLTLTQIASQSVAQTIETKAKQALLVDFDTGTVLFEKNADERMPPASMSKMMTVYLLFEKLKAGEMKLTDQLPVSETAWRMQGSKMFVAINSRVAIEDLIRGITIQSGNDACIVVAEAIAGNEKRFSELMTKRARELGLTSSNFTNSNGWPDPEDYSTARDLAILGQHLIRDFPEYYRFFSEKEFTYNKIKQENRNPLLYRSVGADGIKTGHIEDAGYGLTASAKQGERRLVLVLNGLGSVKERDDEAVKMMSWGFREFDNRTLFRAGQVVEQADVWLGAKNRVPLTASKDVTVTLPRGIGKDLKVKVVYAGPLKSPIAQGQELGRLVIEAPRIGRIEQPLIAGEAVDQRPFFGRIAGAASYVLFGAAAD